MPHPTYHGFETVIGLEVHAQLATNTKLFSQSPNHFGDAPNRNINPVCTAQPGALPVLNRKAVEFAIRAGIATNCHIQQVSVFSRKNYFYPDLPKGYQISQFDKPICLAGWLDIEFEDEPGLRETKRINITRIHMEEDAGKSQHLAGFSLVDLNRAGTPLIEIVSEPDFRSPAQAAAYLKKLRGILQYTEVCDGNMQEGNLRCDANVSVRKVGETRLGTRAELKNLNSFRFLEKAIEYEIQRQINVINSGGKVVQETRLYDPDKGETRSMRSKEEANDYRYFPDPDLLPLEIDGAFLDAVRATLPELPDAKAARFAHEYGLSEYDAGVLTASRELAAYYEEVVRRLGGEPKLAANWVSGDLAAFLNRDNLEIDASRVGPAQLAGLVGRIADQTISGKIAKDVFEAMWVSGRDADAIIAEKGLRQITDTGAIERAIDEVMARNPGQLAEYRAGKDKLFGFFVGQTMKATQGKANPAQLNELLRKKLTGP